MSSNEIFVVPYDHRWPERFRQLSGRLRAALGPAALRIDHIGSTAVPHLSAKPVIDLQISVAALEPVEGYRHRIEALGFIWRAGNTDRMKRYFREVPGARRTHIHVRRAGSWSEQFALLFRDYLRQNPAEAERYAALKIALATQYPDDWHAYTSAKEPFIWETIRRADAWAHNLGWEPGPADC
jgi:GrpB-like predicted nucleotidyltransferase (UPF0157 family)